MKFVVWRPLCFGRVFRAKRGAMWCLVACLLCLGCGPSVQAVYEGDVRFEHCMALDSDPTVKPRYRRACWVEWIAFYTYGQTRDRVVHAQFRIRQLSGVSDFPPAEDQAAPERPPGAPTLEGCTGGCQAQLEPCQRDCPTVDCRRQCTGGFRNCLRACGQ